MLDIWFQKKTNKNASAVLVLAGASSSIYFYSGVFKDINFQKIESSFHFELDFINEEYFKVDKKNALKKLVNNLFAKLNLKDKKINQLDIILGYPWSYGHFQRIDKKFRLPHKYTNDLERKILIDRQKNYRHQTIKKDQYYNLIDSKLLDVKLNSYRIKDPEGKHAENFSLLFYEGLIKEKFLNLIKLEINKFCRPIINFHSLDLNYLKPLEIPVKTLDIAMAKDFIGVYFYHENLEKVFHFPGGTRKVLNILATNLYLPANEIKQILKNYELGKTDNYLSVKLEITLEKIFQSIAEEIIQKMSILNQENWWQKIDQSRLILPNVFCNQFSRILQDNFKNNLDTGLIFNNNNCFNTLDNEYKPVIIWDNNF